MNDRIKVEKIKERFGSLPEITNKDIFLMYREDEPVVPETTVNWRIYHLVQDGIIQRIGRGRYVIGRQKEEYEMPESGKMKSLANLISSEFPYINYCVWELSEINQFLQHLINFNITFLDIERVGIDSAYAVLKDKKAKVFRIKDIMDSLSDYNGYVCIRPLVTEAPVNPLKIKTAKIEKILVDLFCDKEFISFQGNEIYHIFSNAFNRYIINESALLRYANRKKRKVEIEGLIKSIKRH